MNEVTPPSNTIDITNLVGAIERTWVSFTTKIAIEAAKTIPYVGPVLRFPVISQFTDYILEKVVTAIGKGAEQQAFFLNTAIRKAGQAGDFMASRTALDSLPPTVSEEEYKRAETQLIIDFRNFVMVSN